MSLKTSDYINIAKFIVDLFRSKPTAPAKPADKESK